ncbi:MAG: S-layer homology domain-containing protein, partial [Clostridiaceae bacterium]|nr:S-layer homology domain-containing protein [Clostridiaceae bacterium]
MKGKTEFKRSIAFIISFIMLITMMPFFAFGEASDLQGHWASDIIKEWMQDGLVNGYPDGSFRPDNPMTRAELMVLTNKVFEFSEQASISFKDVKEEDWFYTTIKQGIAAGYISGYPDNTIRPNNPISRQEAAIILARVMELPVETTGVKNFNDVSSIPSWSKGYISAVVSSGYMRGYPDGEFKPTEAITRAEVLVVLNNARIDIAEKDEKQKEFTRIFDKAGSYGSETGEEVFEGDVYIKTEGVTLQNMVIQGDLTITEEVGDGDVYLNNVTVEGDTHIQGGGKDSIYINDGSYNKVIIHKIRGGVRVISIGANITEIQVHSRTAGNEVILKGTFKDVFVLAGGINLITQENTTIEKLTIGNQAKNNNVTTSKETIINETIVNSKTEFKNEGTIKRATGTAARNSNYDVNQPDNFTTPSGGGGGGSSSPSTARVSAITVTPPAGKVAMGTKVTLSTATAGATIYYTLDDSTPTTSSNQYTDPITINSAITIKAIGVKSGMNNSSVATFSYTVEELAKPEMTVSPSQVTVDSDFNQTFTLSIANDTVVNTVYAKDHSLEGVFQGMSLGTVARTNNTTVTVAVYGNLANAGTGTITLDADALVDSESNLTVNVTVLEATVIPVGGITVTGNAVVGETLTATPNPSNAEGTYQWKRSNTSDGAYENIGIDSNIYEIAAGDEGKYIRVVFIASGNYTGNPTSNVIGPVTTVTAYEIGDTGPAGGIIFYDKGNDDDGWRYLEVSPVFTQWSDVSWGGYGTEIGGTADAIGTGALNTSYIVNWLYANGETGKAAQLAYELNVGGYDDWFLPSSNELIELSREISPDSDAGLEEFKNFWSSSEEDTHYVKNIAMWGSSFAGYYPSSMPKNGSTNARAIRAFSGEPSITIPVQSVSLTGADGQDTIAWGETLQMQEVIFPANATNQMVTWESSDEAIATVDGNGLMTALAAGTTDITVTTDDGDFKDTVTITVTVTATTYSITIADVVGGTAEITTNPTAEAAVGETVTVNISNIEGGKQFASIQVNGGDVTATEVKAGEEYTFVMPAEAVTVTVELESSLSSYAEILSYSLSNQTGDSVIHSQAATITVEVPYETDISNLVATFTTSENIQSIKVGGVDQESGTTENDFSSLVTYVVIAEDGTIKEWVVTVNEASTPDFGGGLGTDANPYEIATVEHLDNVRKHLGLDHANTHFILSNDINLGDATSDGGAYWNDGKGWEPIGDEDNPFTGKFDGNERTISNLNINRTGEDYVGLFGYLGNMAKLEKMVIINADVKGKDYVGILTGYNSGGTISDSNVAGNVIGTNYLGGMAGRHHGVINNSHAAANINGNNRTGGLVGYNYGTNTRINNSYATGDVLGNERVGGLAGQNYYYSNIEDSHATGSVTGSRYVGGLVGFNSTSGQIIGSYTTGNVAGSMDVGGLVGRQTATSTPSLVEDSYATGTISGTSNVGGLVGSHGSGGSVRDSYAINSELIRTSGTATSFGRVLGNGSGLTNNFANRDMEGPQGTFNNKTFSGKDGRDHASWYINGNGNLVIIAIAIDSQEGMLTAGQAGSVTFPVITNLADGEELSVALVGEPAGLSISVNPVSDGVAVATVTATDIAEEGIYAFTVDYPEADQQTVEAIYVSPAFAGGLGTEEDPWEINTVEQLNSVQNYLGEHFTDTHFQLIDNIDLTSATTSGGIYYSEGLGWEPIGDAERRFAGKFNGNGFTISGININRPGKDNVGLFGYLSNTAEIKRLNIEDADINGGNLTGILAGHNLGSISDSSATGSVTGNNNVGVLVGRNNSPGVINSSYATGSVIGNDNVGGLVGQNYGTFSEINNSYATSSVIGNRRVGGLVGSNSYYNEINNSYAVGSVTGNSNVGGLVGSNTTSGSVNNSYYDQNTTNQSDTGKGTPKTSAEMTQKTTFTGWDFTEIWSIDAGVSYPYLQDNQQDPKPAPSLTETYEINTAVLGGTATVTTDPATEVEEGITVTVTITDIEGGKQFKSIEVTDANSTAVATTEVSAGASYTFTMPAKAVTITIELEEADFAGGLGTEEDPYKIATVEHLDNVRKYLGSEHENTYFKLVDDIDLGVATSDGGAYWNDGKGWEPIGDANYSNYFMSTFDGGGFSISNLNIYRQDEDYVGLFGYIGSNAKIQNLNLTDATVEGQDYIGVLVGYNVGDIRDITVSGELFGNQFVGGLIGENRTYPTVNNTVSNVNVTGTERVGGLIGQNYGQYIKVENSSAHGKVIGSNRYIGGLVGFNGYWASVNQSHATGDVEGVSTVGGLVGYSHTGNLENSYASGDVTGASQIGGLIGLTYAGSPNRSYITNCFALGSVKGETE